MCTTVERRREEQHTEVQYTSCKLSTQTVQCTVQNSPAPKDAHSGLISRMVSCKSETGSEIKSPHPHSNMFATKEYKQSWLSQPALCSV